MRRAGFLASHSLMFSCFTAGALLLSWAAAAQGLRDPTLPPVDAGFVGSSDVTKSAGVEPGAMSVIVRNGRAFVVVGTRLYAQGQKIGEARIERISETAIWLREGGVLRKLPQFTGIERRTLLPDEEQAVCSPATPKTSKTKLPTAACAGAQPGGLSP